ncbi:hypothetical protein GM51_5080 [freshwater metagenome]|uniref:Gram-positive cocci surface proteins LPxTG domain-containing protein n=1 Tax=freshwater metagenome TaxID=449393 RepID=A0A094R0U2_9ZZZZ
MKITRRAISVFLAATVASIALTAFGSTSAHADAAITTDVSEAAPGGSVQFTITPDPSTGLTELCSSSTAAVADPPVVDADTSNNVTGFSVSVLFASEAGMESLTGNTVTLSGLGGQFDGPGEGSFNPTTVSTPLVFSVTVPEDATPGVYGFFVSCTGPTTYWGWESSASIPFFVTAAPDPDPAQRELPDTGHSKLDLTMLWGAGLATTLAGVALIVVMRRRAKA